MRVLVAAFSALLIFLLAGPVHAAIPPSGSGQWVNQARASCTGGSAEGARDCHVAWAMQQNPSCNWSSSNSTYVDSKTFTYYFYSGSGTCSNYNGTVTVLLEELTCPANSSLSGGSCVCNAGYVESGSTCVVAPAPNLCDSLSGQSSGSYSGVGRTGEKQLCDPDMSSGDSAKPGCYMRGFAEIAVQYGEPPEYHWVAKMTYTGGKCSPDPNGTSDYGSGSSSPPGTSAVPNADNAPFTCSAGKVPGSVNGTPVCVDPGPSTPVQKSTTGTTSTTQADGTQVQQQVQNQTTCTGSDCTTQTTTTTTTTPPGGTASVGVSVTSSTCSRLDPSCGPGGAGGGGGDGDSSGFGGSCSSGFTCEGDAVQCATAKASWEHRCISTSLPDDVISAAQSALTAQGSLAALAVSGGEVRAPSAVTGSCEIHDFTVTLLPGQTLSVPLSTVCQFMDTIRGVIGVFGALAFAMIVFRG